MTTIQPAALADVQICRQFDMAYTTDYVWQLQTNETGRAITLRFDTIRLPRPMQVSYPRLADELVSHWEAQGCFLIARDDDETIVGFLDAQPDVWERRLTVHNLVVDKLYRRRQIGTALLMKAIQWAERSGLQQVMLEMQTKNHPAISFAQKHGFVFCGYNERYYSNGDITIFFARSV